MSNGWEDDDFFDGDDDETDMGDDEEHVEPPKPSPVVEQKSVSQVRPKEKISRDSNGRRIRVKPMTATMRKKWPDVVSCMLTLSSGKQVIFVRS